MKVALGICLMLVVVGYIQAAPTEKEVLLRRLIDALEETKKNEACEDSNEHCAYWASTGECDSEVYRDYMLVNCQKSCDECQEVVCRHTPLGMENGDIPNENIQASSIYDSNYAAWNARINGLSPWVAGNEDNAWIQADIGYQTFVSGVVTQGGGRIHRWVTSMKVSTFATSTEDTEVFVTNELGDVMVFQANTDISTAVTSLFPAPIQARVVRITCLTKSSPFSAMRLEILGCKKGPEKGPEKVVCTDNPKVCGVDQRPYCNAEVNEMDEFIQLAEYLQKECPVLCGIVKCNSEVA